MSTPSFDALAATLASIGALAEPAELHGELCAMACVLGPAAGAPWVKNVVSGAKSTEGEKRAVADQLDDLAELTLRALDDGDMSLQLFLPDDEESLETRADALGHWCQGFMHGLGATAQSESVLEQGSLAEIIEDFSEITRASFSHDETEEEAEGAYAELVEFVRVSAQLVFEELAELRLPLPSKREH